MYPYQKEVQSDCGPSHLDKSAGSRATALHEVNDNETLRLVEVDGGGVSGVGGTGPISRKLAGDQHLPG